MRAPAQERELVVTCSSAYWGSDVAILFCIPFRPSKFNSEMGGSENFAGWPHRAGSHNAARATCASGRGRDVLAQISLDQSGDRGLRTLPIGPGRVIIGNHSYRRKVAGGRPASWSLGLLPSGPDPVGEGCVRRQPRGLWGISGRVTTHTRAASVGNVARNLCVARRLAAAASSPAVAS